MDVKSEIPFDDETVKILLGKDQIFVKKRKKKKSVSFSMGKYGEFQKKENKGWIFGFVSGENESLLFFFLGFAWLPDSIPI